MPTETKLRNLITQAKEQEEWDFANDVLYRLCKEHPEHTDPKRVAAKVWLIGRSYAAAIERGRDKSNKPNNDEFYMETVGPDICDSDIDIRLQECTEMFKLTNEKLTNAIVEKSIEVHGEITEELYNINQNRRPRSLASKYLHFHFPDFFFIYDSRASIGLNALSKVLELESKLACTGDNYYRIFAGKCLSLYGTLSSKYGHELTTRQLDNLLLLVEQIEDKDNIVV